MHAMGLSVVLLTLTAVWCAFRAFFGPEGRHRGVLGALAAGSLILGLSMLLLLAYAQQPVCDALGGRWIDESEACRHEWGGNGNNDPGNKGILWLV